MRKVVAHATPALHQLHLLFIYFHYSTVRIGITLRSYDKAIGKAGNLIRITNSGHGTTLWNNVFKLPEQVENVLCAHGVWILFFYSGNLISQSPMHIFGRFFVDISKGIFYCVLADPYFSSHFVAFEILGCCRHGLFKRINCSFFFHFVAYGHIFLLTYLLHDDFKSFDFLVKYTSLNSNRIGNFSAKGKAHAR